MLYYYYYYYDFKFGSRCTRHIQYSFGHIVPYYWLMPNDLSLRGHFLDVMEMSINIYYYIIIIIIMMIIAISINKGRINRTFIY